MRQKTPSFRELTDLAVGASGTANRWRMALLRSVAIILAAAGFLSLSGAFGTEPASIGVRFAFWIGLLAIGTGCNRLAQFALTRRRVPGPPMLRAVLVSLAVSLPMTPIVVLMVNLTFGDQHAGLRLWTYVLLAGFAISAAVAALHVLAEQRAPVSTQAAAPGDAPAIFLKRLPPKLRGAELHAVEAQDHYLRLHTSRGADLILMRLADALDELEGLEGARTHRSWWVARDAVQGIRRESGRVVLITAGGVEAPVSRTYLAALREDGWLG